MEETQTCTRHDTRTFDSREVNAGVLMNPNAVADDTERALLKCTGACHQLKAKQKKKDVKTLTDIDPVNLTVFSSSIL